MSRYSHDSLERNDCLEEPLQSNRSSNEVINLEPSRQSKITAKKHESVSLNIIKLSSPISDVLNETSGCSALNGSLVSSRNLIIAVDSFTRVEEKSRLDPRDNKDSNDNVIRDGLCTMNVAAHQRKGREKEEEERVKKTLPLSTGCRKTFPRIVTPMGSMRHTKKLSGVADERASWRMEESVRRSVSYLERYRRRTDVVRNRRACSSESSSLSICGDNSVERLMDVKSRASSGFPGDDQSELSLYKRLMNQTSRTLETSRSCESFQDDGDDHLRNGDGSASLRNIDVRSTPENKLNQPKFPGYRRYSLKDLKTLSVPRRDRSLGPDPVEVRKKRERLVRHRLYGDAVSARNRQRILQEVNSTDRIVNGYKVGHSSSTMESIHLRLFPLKLLSYKRFGPGPLSGLPN
ncbi:uncharacterized protein LOC107272773 isoform X2 [Cephus cinctus]|uniref:Uncharacterized protein LOC107272773 isoform X2 n=1 Tax=Cephus cinctus TaxID=211228 RepID=A0AAJ7CAB8_CEPCN|nr:uncharacterized protein LOC107272773 isoform X2 [Cephus cinctus]